LLAVLHPVAGRAGGLAPPSGLRPFTPAAYFRQDEGPRGRIVRRVL